MAQRSALTNVFELLSENGDVNLKKLQKELKSSRPAKPKTLPAPKPTQSQTQTQTPSTSQPSNQGQQAQRTRPAGAPNQSRPQNPRPQNSQPNASQAQTQSQGTAQAGQHAQQGQQGQRSERGGRGRGGRGGQEGGQFRRNYEDGQAPRGRGGRGGAASAEGAVAVAVAEGAATGGEAVTVAAGEERPRGTGGEERGRGRGRGTRGRGRGGFENRPRPVTTEGETEQVKTENSVDNAVESVQAGGEYPVKHDRKDRERYEREKIEQQGGRLHGGKRVFERRSATGRNPTENKKGGAGAHNWGSEIDSEVTGDQTVHESEEGKEEKKVDSEATEAPSSKEDEAKKEEEKKISIEEYYKSQEEKRPKIPLPAPRKPGEGVAEPANWSQFFEYKRTEEDEAGDGQKEKKKEKKSGTKPVALDSLFNLHGGEAKPKKAKNEKSKRKDDTEGDSKPALNDKKAFPALAGSPAAEQKTN